MDETSLRLLRERIARGDTQEGGGVHIGLVNVSNRLRLLFGQECALSVQSALQEGTCVSFSFPFPEGTQPL